MRSPTGEPSGIVVYGPYACVHYRCTGLWVDLLLSNQYKLTVSMFRKTMRSSFSSVFITALSETFDCLEPICFMYTYLRQTGCNPKYNLHSDHSTQTHRYKIAAKLSLTAGMQHTQNPPLLTHEQRMHLAVLLHRQHRRAGRERTAVLSGGDLSSLIYPKL